MKVHQIKATDLAAFADVESKQIYRIIKGEHAATLSTIYLIAKGLGVKPRDLFDFDFRD